ncbi:MAG TPA: polysaccharide deacetylase family protein [Pseudolabrys sp.]|nr:polysaccharide deacetylase family protein [Pseudolabrys sp.]
MTALKNTIIRSGLNGLYFSGGHHVLRPVTGGVGFILTFHHVRPARPDPFQPNRLLEVTPAFLEQVLQQLVRAGIEVVSLDEMHDRMVQQRFSRRFACLTFDDGYRDNLRFAYPLLKRFNMPFAIYLPTSFPDRFGELWWLTLERVIANSPQIELAIDGDKQVFECRTANEKRRLFGLLYRYLRQLRTEDALRSVVRDLAARYRVDIPALCDELCMTWDEIRDLSLDPLATIGAHTVNHVMLKKIADARTARSEMDMSRSVIEAAIGVRPAHLSYPVGDATSAGPREFRIAAELGFKSAVTTRPGVLFSAHRHHLTALPRISVNGEFAQRRYLKVLTSGAATAMWNGFRRVNVA